VTLTLSEETKVYYTEVGIQRVRIRKAMAGAIILEVLGDKERNKATALAARLTQAFDPATVRVTAPARTAELRVGSTSRSARWSSGTHWLGAGDVELWRFK
jgi:hypothetical protein